MTANLPNYKRQEPPDGKPPEDFTTHERRAAILQCIISAGSPSAVKQVRLAEEFGVAESTISRDMDRLRESVGEHLGDGARLTTQVIFEKTVRELQNEGEWKEAWDVAMDWNEWLADLGAQHREPDRVEADVASRHAEVAYTIVRADEDGELPTTGDGIDYEAIGFTNGPATVDVEPVEDLDE